MVYTYTRTYTEQEKIFRQLNRTVYSIIKYSMEDINITDYKRFTPEGNLSDEKPINLYSEGLLTTDEFIIKKENGLPRSYSGDDLMFRYADKEGEIYSFGEEYKNSYVTFGKNNPVAITELINNSKEYEYVKGVLNKLQEFDEIRRAPKIGHKL